MKPALAGTAGVPPAVSAKRENVFAKKRTWEKDFATVARCGRAARGPSEERPSSIGIDSDADEVHSCN